MATQTEDLDDELDPDLVGEGVGDDDLEEDEEDVLAAGFVLEGEDVEEPDDADEGSTVAPPVDVVAEESDDDFADEPTLAVIASGEDDEEDDIPVRRSGEFICTRCYLVKNNSQLANRKQKVCRDCA